MHSDLSPHLHTPECNEIIAKLKACHKNHQFLRFLGYCTELDDLMIKCLRKERLARQAANHAKAEKRNKELRERLRTYSQV